MDAFRDWLEGLTARELAAYALVALAVGGAVVLWGRSRPPTPVPTGPVLDPGPSATSAPPPIVVHVAGLVRRPGVYTLDEGARVIDAIELAGGARPKAALEALNLAAVLTDGQQVLVPKRGPTQATETAPDGGGSGTELVNVNTADAAALETLPGIGEVLAQRIIDHREAHGPFAAVDDLIDVSGIGEVTLEELRPLVTV